MAPGRPLLLLLLSALAVAQDDGSFELHIVHLNDFHARFDPINGDAGTCNEGDACFGGIARVASKAKELIAAAPNGNYLLLNAGDNFQGTIWYSLYRWNVTAQILNMIPFDANTLGNHEFDNNIEGVVPFLENLNCPTVDANIDTSNEPTMQGTFNKSIVLERGGRQIGIVGYIIQSTPDISSTGNLIFLDEADSLAEEAARLKSAGVDIIIALSHAGIDVDMEVAAKVADVDVIVGGHSHTLLYTGTPPDGDTALDVYPVMVTQDSGRQVAIVQAGAYTKYLGYLVATFDQDGELVSATGNPIILDETVEQDEEVLAALVPWRNGLEEVANQELAQTKVFLDATDSVCHRGECNIGNLIADAMVDEMVSLESFGTGAWTKAAIALTNSGGIRASIEETNNGTITYNDLVTVIPFENTIDYIEIQGSTLRAALEFSINDTGTSSRMRTPRASDFYAQTFLQYSGLHVTFDARQPVGSRVVNVSALCRQCDVPQYEPLDDSSWYPVAINSFLADGGDAYYMLRDEARNRTIGRVDTDVVTDYMQKQSPITQGLDGRTTVISDDSK